jgi:hypothetical protein
MLLTKISLGLVCIGLAGTCAAHGLSPYHHAQDLLIPAAAIAAAVAFGAQVEKRFATIWTYPKQR